MATTRQMIDWIVMNAEGWDRDGQRGILPILNQVQKILLQNETSQTLAYNKYIGDFPSMPTIDGIYEYELPVNIWRVSEVLLPYPLSPDYGVYSLSSDYNYINHERKVDIKSYYHKKYVRMRNIQTLDKSESSNCIIRFQDNPGSKISPVSSGVNTSSSTNQLIDSGATFITSGVKIGMGVTNETDGVIAFVTSVPTETQLILDRHLFTATSKSYKVGFSDMMYRGYEMPANLTSENVRLSGTEKFHLEILLPATVAAIEAFENGGWAEVMRLITDVYKPKMINEQNEGEQSLTYETERREA